MAHEKPEILKHLSSKGEGGSKMLAVISKSKLIKKLARKASKTDCLSLEKKREELEQQRIAISAMMEELIAGNCDQEQREKMMNHMNLLGMNAMILGIGLMVDCTSEASKCRIRQPDGSLKPGTKRISVAETTTDIHDMVVDLTAMVEVVTGCVHQTAKHEKVWIDKHNVSISPYEKEMDGDDDDAKIPEVGADQGALADEDAHQENVDLRQAREFIAKDEAAGEKK